MGIPEINTVILLDREVNLLLYFICTVVWNSNNHFAHLISSFVMQLLYLDLS